MNYQETLEHNASMRRDGGKGLQTHHIHIEMANSVPVHIPVTPEELKEMAKGPKPQLPEGHVLHHIAKLMDIPHEVIGKTHGKPSEEPEKEADEQE